MDRKTSATSLLRQLGASVDSVSFQPVLPSGGPALPADAPNFERYDDKFDPSTGNGGLEIWVPVQ